MLGMRLLVTILPGSGWASAVTLNSQIESELDLVEEYYLNRWITCLRKPYLYLALKPESLASASQEIHPTDLINRYVKIENSKRLLC